MSEFAPFIKWGQYKSKDPNTPDDLELKVKNPEPFETSFSINIEVFQKEDKKWTECILPLKSHDSKNSSLLLQWKKAKLKPETKFHIKTWLSTSRNGFPIRRFSLET